MVGGRPATNQIGMPNWRRCSSQSTGGLSFRDLTVMGCRPCAIFSMMSGASSEPEMTREMWRSDKPSAAAIARSVSNPLAGNFTLELGEREQHVESQPSHRGGRVEGLRHGDKRRTARIQAFDEFGEVAQRASQSMRSPSRSPLRDAENVPVEQF